MLEPDIRTARLLLRPWQAEDAAFAFDLYSRWEVARFLGRAPRAMERPEEGRDLVERLQAREDARSAYRIVEVLGTGVAVGTVMAKPIPASGPEPLLPSADTEIGWHFHPDHWGHGYAAEAASALLAAALASGLPRVVAVTYPGNLPSQRLAERIGMRRLGTTGAYYNAALELFEAP